MDKHSYLSNADGAVIEDYYQQYLNNPQDVGEGWQKFFEGFEFARKNYDTDVPEGFDKEFFNLSSSDFMYLFILASICTAYAFIASVHVMKYISPYSVVLAYNLEPVYGIILAIILFPNEEKMSPNFYLGAIIIFSAVILNGIFKNKKKITSRIQKKKI